jgi:FixJ family two-component response regulator
VNKIKPKIFIVDDDVSFCKSLARLVKAVGFDVETFLSAQEFLERKTYEGPCCLLLDVRMPGLTGPDLQRELIKRKSPTSIIFLTAQKNVTTGVNAMKDGAVDYLLKPVKKEDLFAAIDRALDKDAQIKKMNEDIREIELLLSTLTEREMEVLQWIITGMLNKQIAWSLGITEVTVKVHKGHIMRKLNLESVADLVRMAEKAGISPAKDIST